VNVDVVARAGSVYVAYGTRTHPGQNGGFVQQQLSVSTNRGRSFGPAMSIGPRSVLRYAAQSRGYFPGDYIGAAIARGRLYMVWAVSSKPPASSTSIYHQVIYGATLRP
jgi:outer membrane receptor for monomeric catechols